MRKASPLVLLPILAGLAVFFVWPMTLALQAAASPSAWSWVVQEYARNRIAGAFLQAILSLALATAFAVPIALLHHRWSIRGSRALLALHALPFVMPVFVIVGGLRETLGPGGWLHQATGLDLLTTIGPWGSVALANATYNAGLAAFLLHTAFERRPRSLERAAAVLGAPPHAQWQRITWPALRPAILSTLLLVLLFCLGSFGVVLLLGQGRIDTLDTLLYAQQSGAFPREDRAAVLAVLQLVVQASLLLAVLALGRRERQQPQQSPQAKTSHPLANGIAWALAAISTLVWSSVLVGAFRVGGRWSFAAWRALTGGPGHLGDFNLGHALLLSIGYAVAATLCALLLTALLAYAGRGLLARGTELLAFLPLGTSSVVLGFAFLLAFTGRTWLPLIGNPWGIVAAHTLITFPFVARTVLPALRALDERLDQAAATLGASLGQRIRRIHVPLLRGPLATACAFAAALSLGDYGASLLLMTSDTMSITVWIDRHGGPGAFDPLARAQSTALAAILLLLTLALAGIAALAQPRRRTT